MNYLCLNAKTVSCESSVAVIYEFVNLLQTLNYIATLKIFKMTKMCAIIIKVFKFVSFVGCILLFVVLTEDVWTKYQAKYTSLGVRFVEKEESSPKYPFITFCALSSFRSRKAFYTKKEFLENTFELVII